MSASGSGNLAYDTERQYIGTVYAKGLLGAAEKANQVTQVVDELESIVVDVLPQLPKLKLLLESPRVPMEVKEKVLNQSFSAGSSVLLTFLKVVCRHGRFDCLRVISRTATALLQEQTGVVEVRVTTAESVPESMHEELKTKLGQILEKQVVIRTETDADILGGLVVRVGDTVFDGSVANQLSQIRRTAVDQAMQQIRQSLDRFAVDAS
ncbi:MAG: ATP synthase F1 subunit delta [Planctomycetota bacterium]|jgi:F-type H+-transporting ATPase subunit delta|nr:ATP synthase F1 subunit delta [Planctomycetota bacterium]MEC7430058.1 ATP synthase F1 subunit delta [Planctomycetota bacterium]MEC7450326.1 ATP synthase F1 subunit delta [Planctomycetota bacterium]MEC7599328.1 ATP synthase F1 subunit delta [Planctomycetota bacterium]MEC7603227.1 ATP synthase F1 subunit delta [Planctomycetota bacterium]